MTTSEIPFDYFMICMILMACSSDKRVQRALKYLPAAAFPALFVPAIAFTRGTGDFAFNPIQIIAGSAALVVALYTKNIYATLGVGMCALWGLRYFVG
jgi:branched-subunit amino acid transport protein